MDKLEAGFAMGIVDQGQEDRCDVVAPHREQRFSPDLIDEAIARGVAAGAVDLVRQRPRPYRRVRSSAVLCHLSARASHETYL